MNQMEMLRQMVQEVLTDADLKAICKARGLAGQATTSRPMLEALFLSEVGVAAALRTLERPEIALLHLLACQDKPVDVAFFKCLDSSRSKGWSRGTFSQQFQGVFSRVKERLVRRGILLLALGPETSAQKTKMERWQFALPAQLACHLPPLLEAARHLSGDGDWHPNVAREKLKAALSQAGERAGDPDRVEIVNGTLCWGGRPFRTERLGQWQLRRWQAETDPTTRRNAADPYRLSPAEAVLRILAGLGAGLWSDPDALAVPLEIFSGSRCDAEAVCASGWRWGLLARQEAEGRTWYRLAPAAAVGDAPPERYLTVREEGVTVDLDTVPWEALETLLLLTDQRAVPEGRPLLLVTPNLVKLGRAADTLAGLPLAAWLEEHAAPFRRAFETARLRRGKTVLHENLSVARVRDLSLKVALEKALGARIVPLGEEYLAFPAEAVAEVKRLVAQLGHVVQEVGHREP